MTSTTSDTPKVSAGFDINAEFRSVMHGLGLSPANTRRHNYLRWRRPDLPKCASARRVHQYPDHSRSGGDRRHLASAHRPRPGPSPDTITAQTPYGEYVRLAPPAQFSATKPYWRDLPLVVRRSSKPAWTTA